MSRRVSADIAPYLGGYEGRSFIWEPPPVYRAQHELRVSQAINPRLPFLNTKKDIAIHDLFHPDRDIIARERASGGRVVGRFMGRNVVERSERRSPRVVARDNLRGERRVRLPTVRR